ncbi:MAG TPA: PucR family transcriptional regulator [Conexibacter sp.]|jgi:purine catabolism regulator|nr:PucR family transcriptional regulator [Conexibacter sp.]
MKERIEVADSIITVRDALSLPVLRRGLPTVVAGAEQLDRPIRWVHAGEVPDIASLLSGGELLLSTGLGIGATGADQERFIAQLVQRDIAGLVVELGDRMPEVPAALVRAAGAHRFPLVTLARRVPFVEITEEIHTAIVNARYTLIRRSDDVQQQLMQLVVDGCGTAELIERVGAEIGNPVFLEDGDGRLLYHAASGHDHVDPLEAWEASTRAAGRGWQAGISEPVPTGPRTPPWRLIALPVRSALGDSAPMLLQRAAGVVALSLLQSNQEEELLARERGNFLGELMLGRARANAGRLAESLGFPAGADQLLPVAAEIDAQVEGAAWSVVLRDVQQGLERAGVSSLVGARPRVQGLLTVVALRRPTAWRKDADTVAAALHAAVRRRAGATDPRIAVGQPTTWLGVGQALRIASETASAVTALPARSWHDVQELELQRLLWRWRHDAELAGFVQRRLGPLIAHDTRRRHQLLPTLEALAANGWRKAETARGLHLNRQALYKRLGRIEELLGVDLSDGEQVLALQVALSALPYVRCATIK